MENISILGFTVVEFLAFLFFALVQFFYARYTSTYGCKTFINRKYTYLKNKTLRHIFTARSKQINNPSANCYAGRMTYTGILMFSLFFFFLVVSFVLIDDPERRIIFAVEFASLQIGVGVLDYMCGVISYDKFCEKDKYLPKDIQLTFQQVEELARSRAIFIPPQEQTALITSIFKNSPRVFVSLGKQRIYYLGSKYFYSEDEKKTPLISVVEVDLEGNLQNFTTANPADIENFIDTCMVFYR